jgi:hypothetical protein
MSTKKDMKGTVDLWIKRFEIVEFDEAGKKVAADRVAADGVLGMSDRILQAEWKNDVVCRLTEAEFRPVAADPLKAYLEWLDDRLMKPYSLPRGLFRKVRQEYGDSFANDFDLCGWPCEIAWARRYRRGEDRRLAVLGQIFLMSYGKSPVDVVMATALMLHGMASSLAWFHSNERHMEPSFIIHLESLRPDFLPAFARVADDMHGPTVDKLSSRDIEIRSERAAKEEDGDRCRDASRGSALMIERRGWVLSRQTSVLFEAIKMQLSSDDLHILERSFIEELKAGKIGVGARPCLPTSQFIDYIKVKGLSVSSMSGERRPASLSPIDSDYALRWISDLPDDYKTMAAKRKNAFAFWSSPLIQKQRVAPIDLIADYGMHLVRTSYTGVPKDA